MLEIIKINQKYLLLSWQLQSFVQDECFKISMEEEWAQQRAKTKNQRNQSQTTRAASVMLRPHAWLREVCAFCELTARTAQKKVPRKGWHPLHPSDLRDQSIGINQARRREKRNSKFKGPGASRSLSPGENMVEQNKKWEWWGPGLWFSGFGLYPKRNRKRLWIFKQEQWH